MLQIGRQDLGGGEGRRLLIMAGPERARTCRHYKEGSRRRKRDAPPREPLDMRHPWHANDTKALNLTLTPTLAPKLHAEKEAHAALEREKIHHRGQFCIILRRHYAALVFGAPPLRASP